MALGTGQTYITTALARIRNIILIQRRFGIDSRRLHGSRGGAQEAGGLRWRERWDGEGEARRARTRRDGGIVGDEQDQHACRGEMKIKVERNKDDGGRGGGGGGSGGSGGGGGEVVVKEEWR